MTRPEVRDRAAVEVLLDDRGADVGRPSDGRRISEALGDPAHDSRESTLRLGLPGGNLPLGERDRSGERAAPRAEVLGSELVAQVLAHVVVERAAGQVEGISFDAVAEQSCAPW